MFRRTHLQVLSTLLLLIMASASFAKDYIIYSIAQDIPMGVKDEKLKKDFYINMGTSQGVRSGTKLSVFRVLSTLNPYDSNKRYSYKIPVGELQVIHAENEASIARGFSIKSAETDPQLEIVDFMIGDHVGVHVTD